MSTLSAKKVELEELKDQRPLLEKKRDDAQKGYKIGAITFLIGIPLIFAYGIGFLLIIVGALAGLTQYAKRKKYDGELEDLNQKIKQLRREIAELESN